MDSEREPDPVEVRERSLVDAGDLSWALRAVNRAGSTLDQAVAARLGLRLMDYAAFSHILSAAPDPIGPGELGQRLGITTGSATELVDRLERADHIVRQRAVDDRRRVALVPREHSVERTLGELTPLFARLDELADEFTPEEQAVIARYLRGAQERLAVEADELGRRGRS